MAEGSKFTLTEAVTGETEEEMDANMRVQAEALAAWFKQIAIENGLPIPPEGTIVEMTPTD